MIQQPKSTQNGFTFQIKNPGSTRNSVPNNMVAMKRIQNYSYALSDEIGLGFTSHVYRGKDEITNKQVAVKVIELKNTQDQLHANFLRDQIAVLEMIKNADFTNLLKLEKVIKSKNNLYIITEFCEGNDVAKILRKKKLFNEVEAQSIMKQMLNGYKELYNLRLVHRDLKLANLFITKGQVKIADFGFTISEQQCNIKMEYNVGSPYYMPPQSLKQNKYSFQSDVWAIGVIAYQLVYGRVPWKDRDDAVLFDMVMSTPVEMLFDSDKQVSDHYKKFIKACLVNDKRFRATPQFIINYPWPVARDYVDGLEDNNQFRYSIGGKGSIPRISGERPQIKKMNSINTQDPRGIRRRTPSVDNLRSLGRIQQKGPVIPGRHSPAVVQSFMQEGSKPRPVESSRQRYSREQLKSRSRARSKSLQRQDSRKRINQSHLKENFIEENYSQKAIVGQIHYCRFMFELYKILKNLKNRNENLNFIEYQLSNRILEKMQVLVSTAKNQTNNLKCPGFQTYIQTQRWQSLRQVIYKYDMKFRQQLHQNSFNSSKAIDNNSQIIQTIRELIKNLSINLKIIEFLTYYYQLKQEQMKIPTYELNERIKLDYLVDECRNYAALVNYYEGNTHEQKENQDRLLKKLTILGI